MAEFKHREQRSTPEHKIRWLLDNHGLWDVPADVMGDYNALKKVIVDNEIAQKIKAAGLYSERTAIPDIQMGLVKLIRRAHPKVGEDLYRVKDFVEVKKGGPKLNILYTLHEHSDVIVLEGDMASKYECCLGEGTHDMDGEEVVLLSFLPIPGLTIKLQEGLEEEETQIAIPGTQGFDVFCCQIARYTLYLVLHKRPPLS